MRSYREIVPTGSLRDLVETAWQSRTGASSQVQRVLPDGCMDLLVLGGELIVAGPDTAAHLATSAPGAVTTGLRFRPGAMPALLGVPADVLRDRRTPLRDVLAATPPAERGHSAVLRPPNDPAVPRDDGSAGVRWLAGVAGVLRAHAEDQRRPLPDPLPGPAVRALARGASVAEVADRLGVTVRTLHRRSLATLGYGPAVARRVLRFRAAATLLFAGVSPAEVAARSGYADQPHLSREVRALAGVSPAVLAGPGQEAQANRSSGAPSGSRTVAYR